MTTAPEPGLVFDAASHTYSVAGQRVQSVTQVLKSCCVADYSMIAPEVLTRKAALGTLVHEWTALHDQGNEDWDMVIGTDAEPYCVSWSNFREQSGFAPRLIEHPFMANKRGMCYAGTLDREGDLNGRPTVVEIKCSALAQPWWALQLMAYALALQQVARTPPARIAVQLLDNGDFRVHEYMATTDQGIWLAALALAIWKENR